MCAYEVRGVGDTKLSMAPLPGDLQAAIGTLADNADDLMGSGLHIVV